MPHDLEIIVSNAADLPIYEQVARQLKDAILSGVLAAGQPLPSIRALANQLQVSVITTKRAYADLEAQGFIDTVPGKGCFVAATGAALLREERQQLVESLLAQAATEAAGLGCDKAHFVAAAADAWKGVAR